MLKYVIICSGSIILSMGGCATKECPKQEVIITKCVTPDVEKPTINTYSSTSSTSEKIKKVYNNYVIMKEYALTLKKANEVCK